MLWRYYRTSQQYARFWIVSILSSYNGDIRIYKGEVGVAITTKSLIFLTCAILTLSQYFKIM